MCKSCVDGSRRESRGSDGAEVALHACKRKARSGTPIFERQARDGGSFATCSGNLQRNEPLSFDSTLR